MSNNEATAQGVIHHALFRILKSMAAIAMRYGISAGAMTELVRRAYVEAAEESLLAQNKSMQTSRICALTGLYRKEVVRLKELPPVEETGADDRYNRSSRVITGWLRDRDFLTASGKPAVLKLEAENGFNELVRRYSGDMTPRAMMEELVRLKVVEKSERNTVKLLNRGFIPQQDEITGIQILGKDTADLIDTIHHNLNATGEQRNFQRKVSYVHIPERHTDAFRKFAAKSSQDLLESLDRWLARHDTEHPSEGTPGSRLGLGIYMFSDPNKPHESSTPETIVATAAPRDPETNVSAEDTPNPEAMLSQDE